MIKQEISILYTNWKGETGWRKIIPEKVFWGSNEWHPHPQWLMEAIDMVKGETRTFAMKDIHVWRY